MVSTADNIFSQKLFLMYSILRGIILQPLLCFAAEISANWQHCSRYLDQSKRFVLSLNSFENNSLPNQCSGAGAGSAESVSFRRLGSGSFIFYLGSVAAGSGSLRLSLKIYPNVKNAQPIIHTIFKNNLEKMFFSFSSIYG
jgi:hypothetical protein